MGPFNPQVVFLADGASAMGIRRNGTVATKPFKGENFFALLQDKVNEVLGDDARSVIGYSGPARRICPRPQVCPRTKPNIEPIKPTATIMGCSAMFERQATVPELSKRDVDVSLQCQTDQENVAPPIAHDNTNKWERNSVFLSSFAFPTPNIV